MKKITVTMFVFCIFVRTLGASSGLQSPIGNDFVVIGGAEDDLTDALHNEHHNELRNAPVLLVTVPPVDRSRSIDHEQPKKKERHQSSSVMTAKEYKHAAAGVLLGGSLAMLMHDWYGVKGDVVFSLLAGAAFVASRQLEQAVFAEYKATIVSPEGRCFRSGFLLGAQVPLVVSVFSKCLSEN